MFLWFSYLTFFGRSFHSVDLVIMTLSVHSKCFAMNHSSPFVCFSKVDVGSYHMAYSIYFGIGFFLRENARAMQFHGWYYRNLSKLFLYAFLRMCVLTPPIDCISILDSHDASMSNVFLSECVHVQTACTQSWSLNRGSIRTRLLFWFHLRYRKWRIQRHKYELFFRTPPFSTKILSNMSH